MCYELVISTDYNDDLKKFNQPYVYFEKLSQEFHCKNLRHRHQYRIATMCQNCCSCSIRAFDYGTAQNFEFEFVPFQDWLEELDENFDNTSIIFQTIKELVNQGACVDSFLDWCGDENNTPLKSMNIDVNRTIKDNFAFFENIYFSYHK